MQDRFGLVVGRMGDGQISGAQLLGRSGEKLVACPPGRGFQSVAGSWPGHPARRRRDSPASGGPPAGRRIAHRRRLPRRAIRGGNGPPTVGPRAVAVGPESAAGPRCRPRPKRPRPPARLARPSAARPRPTRASNAPAERWRPTVRRAWRRGVDGSDIAVAGIHPGSRNR